MSTASIKAAAVAAASRALSPNPSPKKPKKPASLKSSAQPNSEDSPTPIQAPLTDKKPLRGAETVYYDAQGDFDTPPRSAASALSSLPKGTKNPSGASTKGQIVTVTLSKPDIQPPVYVASSMSDWRIDEMAYEVDQSSDGSQFMFYMDFEEVKPGQHMYRFKPEGHNEWIVDEASPRGEQISADNSCMSATDHMS